MSANQISLQQFQLLQQQFALQPLTPQTPTPQQLRMLACQQQQLVQQQQQQLQQQAQPQPPQQQQASHNPTPSAPLPCPSTTSPLNGCPSSSTSSSSSSTITSTGTSSPPSSSTSSPSLSSNSGAGGGTSPVLNQIGNQPLTPHSIAMQLQQLQQLQLQLLNSQKQQLQQQQQTSPLQSTLASQPQSQTQPSPQQSPPTPLPTPITQQTAPSTPILSSAAPPALPLAPLPALSPQAPLSSSPAYHVIQHQLLRHLVILKQQAAAEERFAKNGIQKNVHVVVKNSPFVVQVGQNPQAQLPHFDLSRVAFECSLVYDTDVPDPQLSNQPAKYVDFVRVKPMEFKAVPTERGDQVSVELRIKVLTSQHEDMFFRVLIQGLDPITRTPITNLRIYTEPIKVISKPEQIKRRLAEDTVSDTKTPRIMTSSSMPVSAPRKRNMNESLVDSLGRIEQQQQQHGKMLEQILEMQQQISPAKRPCLALPSSTKSCESEMEFSAAFSCLLKSYSALDRDHRAVAVRHLVRTVNPSDFDNLSEMIDMLNAEGLKKELGQAIPPTTTTLPALNCEFEEFCRDFATTQSYYF